MAFLKFTRDKRGVENFFLVHSTTNRRGKVRPRVLYWFRSPPDVKVGRQPFEASTRRTLEAQNPDVTFDWRAIVDTPIPSADADKWRERVDGTRRVQLRERLAHAPPVLQRYREEDSRLDVGRVQRDGAAECALRSDPVEVEREQDVRERDVCLDDGAVELEGAPGRRPGAPDLLDRAPLR